MLSGLLAFVAFVIAIVVLAQLSALGRRIDALEKNLRERKPGDEPEPLTTRPAAVPPPLPPMPPPKPATAIAAPSAKSPVPAPAINWESFVGVRLFAWIGGLALFLGVVFFVKYAFDNNLISPRVRILAGALVGVGLIVIGLLPRLRKFRIPAQSVIATGLLICYADIYAAHSFYSLISLTAASGLMWLVTALGLWLAAGLDFPAILWLALIGGFLTPGLFHSTHQSAIGLFGYIGVLNCGVAAVSGIKRWPYFIFIAAICTVLLEFAWAADVFGHTSPTTTRAIFLTMQALFLVFAIALLRIQLDSRWTLFAATLTGLATLVYCLIAAGQHDWRSVFPIVFLSDAGLIALAVSQRALNTHARGLLVIIGAALLLTWLAEWQRQNVFVWTNAAAVPWIVIAQPNAYLILSYIAILLLFSAVPYFCGTERFWTWAIAAVTGPLQFWLVYRLVEARFPQHWVWTLPLLFALPALAGIIYLIKRENVELSSGDSRLAAVGAAVLGLFSLVFPVQFSREWITLGWAVEGVGLILLFRILPNRRLRAVALIVLCAAFIRLALNPAVLYYHPRSQTPIFNWYLYVYGVAGICLFAAGYWFGPPRERLYEKQGPALLYVMCGVIFFLLLNIEIADYFSIGPTLTFSFAGNFARDMTYTISWALFAFGLLILGMVKQIRPLRFAAVVLLCVALAKLFLHDLDELSQLYRIAAFLSVAVIAIVASFAYQRFLSPAVKK